jgi:hypothetical protein
MTSERRDQSRRRVSRIIEQSTLVAALDAAGRPLAATAGTAHALHAARTLVRDFQRLPIGERALCAMLTAAVAAVASVVLATMLPMQARASEPLAAGILVLVTCAGAAAMIRN